MTTIKSISSADNLRRAGRANAHIPITVYQQDDSNALGNVIDISATGMAVVAKTPPAAQQMLALRLEAEHEDGHRQRCEVQAEIVWQRPHKRPGLHLLGFRFHSVSPKARLRIKAIIESLAHAET